MKIRIFKTIFLTLCIVLFLFIAVPKTNGQQCTSKEDCQKMIDEYEQKLAETKKQKNSLSSEILYMDTQIRLTTLKMQNTENEVVKTEHEIEMLTGKIESLNTSLDYLGKILLEKIAEGYKNRETNVFDIVLNSDSASILSKRIKYIKTAEDSDRRMAFKVQQTKFSFEEQKNLRETKKKQLDDLKIVLEQQKSTLDNQKSSKQKLLELTKNDERTFQALLDKIRSEFAAIQGIVSGGGSESKMRDVKKGDMIASIIPSASCNSSGAHLHFIAQENNNVSNPFNYLKPVDSRNCSGPSCGSGNGDPFNPSGSWDWPLNPTIELEQGYGSTWAVNNTWIGRVYNFHNGIDINGSSNDVHAVADGALFRGGFSGSGGCTLPYVKLVHNGSNMITFYLHVYPR